MKNVCWRGVKDVYIIWHGEWSDPELMHGDFVANYWEVEDTMWQRYKELAKEEGYTEEECKELGEAGFNKYCQERAEEIYELIEVVSEY